MTYIKELIAIPERVHQGDFVLKLSEGVSHAEQTLKDYVVTPQLVQCFDNALGFIKQAVDTRSSKAAYLHGSFGSGKSHFMAVLNLLCREHAGAVDHRIGRRGRQAQRLDAGAEVPAGALSHDRRARHGVRDPGAVRGLRPDRSSERTVPGLLPGRRTVPGCDRGCAAAQG